MKLDVHKKTHRRQSTAATTAAKRKSRKPIKRNGWAGAHSRDGTQHSDDHTWIWNHTSHRGWISQGLRCKLPTSSASPVRPKSVPSLTFPLVRQSCCLHSVASPAHTTGQHPCMSGTLWNGFCTSTFWNSINLILYKSENKSIYYMITSI